MWSRVNTCALLQAFVMAAVKSWSVRASYCFDFGLWNFQAEGYERATLQRQP
jgi:hypothetical protein